MGPSKKVKEWWLWYNKELYHLYGAPDNITDIKLVRLRWVGHLQRINNNKVIKKIIENTSLGRRRLEGSDLDGCVDGMLENTRRQDGWWLLGTEKPGGRFWSRHWLNQACWVGYHDNI